MAPSMAPPMAPFMVFFKYPSWLSIKHSPWFSPSWLPSNILHDSLQNILHGSLPNSLHASKYTLVERIIRVKQCFSTWFSTWLPTWLSTCLPTCNLVYTQRFHSHRLHAFNEEIKYIFETVKLTCIVHYTFWANHTFWAIGCHQELQALVASYCISSRWVTQQSSAGVCSNVTDSFYMR